MQHSTQQLQQLASAAHAAPGRAAARHYLAVRRLGLRRRWPCWA
jgi:hypothetical protein